MIRRFKVGYAVELHKRTLERGLLSLIGPRAQAVAGADALDEREHDSIELEIDGVAALAVRTDVGVDLLCEAADTAHLAEVLRRARRRGRLRAGRRVPAYRARPPALRDRPRRHRDSPGGGSQRARGELHKGLLRRTGDGRAPALPGQAQPPPPRPAPVRSRRPPARSCGSASASSATSAARPSPPGSDRSRSRSCGARPSRARSSRSASTTPPPRCSSCRFPPPERTAGPTALAPPARP